MSNSKPPTQRQMNYLRALTERTGKTFAMPATAAEASAEIERMKGEAPTYEDRRREVRDVRDAIARGSASR